MTASSELMAAGAVFAALAMADARGDVRFDQLQPVCDDHGDVTNAIWLRLSFLASRYRITVTTDPEEPLKVMAGGADGEVCDSP